MTDSATGAETGRERQITAFLDAVGWGAARRDFLAGDASFRRYYRLRRDGASAVLMDAPPPQENVGAFHQIAAQLIRLGLSAPRPLGVDRSAGLMLLEDLGDRTYTRALAEGADEAELYRRAIDLLISIHRNWAPPVEEALPSYDDAKLLREASLLIDWYLPAISGQETADDQRQAYLAAWRAVLPTARRVPDCLVLRDYHVDNLMVLDERPGIAACGLLDFQDAVFGPVTYDIVSLLKDARRDVSPTLARQMLRRYLAAFPDLDTESFMSSYAVLGAQRNAKIIGIFTRLCRRDNKPQYLQHMARLWRLLEGDLSYPALAPVKAWFDQALPPAERITPPAGGGR